MKTLILAILLVSLLAISVQAYDQATENAKGTVCATKLATVFSACTSDTTCNAEITTNNNCLNSNATAQKAVQDLQAGTISAYQEIGIFSTACPTSNSKLADYMNQLKECLNSSSTTTTSKSSSQLLKSFLLTAFIMAILL